MSIDVAAPSDSPGELLAGWSDRLNGFHPRVVFADGDDPRVLVAAVELAELGVTPVVVATREGAARAAGAAGVALTPHIELRTPDELASSHTGIVLGERLAAKEPETQRELLRDPLYLATGAVAAGVADACVAGCGRPTSDVLRAALRVVGTSAESRCVTSSFLMLLGDGRLVSYADCAVLPEPDAEQLAEVAVATSRTHVALTGEDPAVAMLSFSTKGSAQHASIELVRTATDRVRTVDPALAVDGELQFDAAFVDSVATSKASASTVAGRANVFVFPNLAAGNIGYKITERLAGAAAYGPVLQGLAAPVNDLSRGCSSADIVNVAVISALQAQTAH